jgi:hypothetical protein
LRSCFLWTSILLLKNLIEDFHKPVGYFFIHANSPLIIAWTLCNCHIWYAVMNIRYGYTVITYTIQKHGVIKWSHICSR